MKKNYIKKFVRNEIKQFESALNRKNKFLYLKTLGGEP